MAKVALSSIVFGPFTSFAILLFWVVLYVLLLVAAILLAPRYWVWLRVILLLSEYIVVLRRIISQSRKAGIV